MGPGEVIGNATKWGTVPDTPEPVFDVVFYDECYQLGWARMWPLMSLSVWHVPVGDPGQCTPFTKAPADRWLGSPTGPLVPAAAVLARFLPLAPVPRLDRSMRLPQDTVDVVQPALYPSLPFTGHAPRGSRLLVPPATSPAARGRWAATTTRRPTLAGPPAAPAGPPRRRGALTSFPASEPATGRRRAGRCRRGRTAAVRAAQHRVIR